MKQNVCKLKYLDPKRFPVADEDVHPDDLHVLGVPRGLVYPVVDGDAPLDLGVVEEGVGLVPGRVEAVGHVQGDIHRVFRGTSAGQGLGRGAPAAAAGEAGRLGGVGRREAVEPRNDWGNDSIALQDTVQRCNRCTCTPPARRRTWPVPSCNRLGPSPSRHAGLQTQS